METISLLLTLVRSVDKPSSIAFHDNKLALGYSNGHVLISALGVPNDFSAADGASAWGVGDRVNGLVSLPGNVLGVFSERSIRSIEGAAQDATGATMRTISSSSGAKEYTVQNIIGPYFADNGGVSNLETSEKYGDFSMVRSSDPVKVWIQDRVQDKGSIQTTDTSAVASVAIRNKNQYRLYFADGYSLVLYFSIDGRIECTFMHYDTENFGTTYVPTFIDSTVLSSGKERIIMGTANGDVWIVDGSEVIQDPDGAIKPNCWIVTNPLNLGQPHRLNKTKYITVQGQFYGAQSVSAWADANYIFDETGAAHEQVTIGDYSDTPIFDSRNLLDDIYLPILTDGVSFKLQTTMDGSRPHSFQALLHRASIKGADRNSAVRAY